MKTPQKQAPKWRPGGRGCGQRAGPGHPVPSAWPRPAPEGSATRGQALPGLRAWNPTLRVEAEVWEAFLTPQRAGHSLGSLRYHPPQPPAFDTRACQH